MIAESLQLSQHVEENKFFQSQPLRYESIQRKKKKKKEKPQYISN